MKTAGVCCCSCTDSRFTQRHQCPLFRHPSHHPKSFESSRPQDTHGCIPGIFGPSRLLLWSIPSHLDDLRIISGESFSSNWVVSNSGGEREKARRVVWVETIAWVTVLTLETVSGHSKLHSLSPYPWRELGRPFGRNGLRWSAPGAHLGWLSMWSQWCLPSWFSNLLMRSSV